VKWQKHNADYDPVKALVSYYGPIRAISQSVDVLPPTASLSGYKLVVAPALNVLSDAAARNLIDYVNNGGHLVLGQRSAMKDDDNTLFPERQPGPLVSVLGGRVEQYYALETPVPVEGNFGKGQGQLWAELLSAKDPGTEILMRYGTSNGWLDNQPAAITRKVGKGRITYIGAWLDDSTMQKAAQWMTDVSGVRPAFGPVPQGVDVYPRYSGNHSVFILVNFAKAEQTVNLPGEMQDELDGKARKSITLPQYGVAVLTAK
jgi:beta-galactosidase